MKVTLEFEVPQSIIDLGRQKGYPDDKIQELFQFQAEGYHEMYGEEAISQECEGILLMGEDEADGAVLANNVNCYWLLPCPKCGDYGTIDNQDGTVSNCPCHY